MNRGFVDNLGKQLRSAAQGVQSPESGDLHNFQMHDGVAYSLTNEAGRTFNDVASKLRKHRNFARKFSAKYLDKNLKKLFAQLLTDDEFDIETGLALLIDELSKFDQKHVVYLKIEGVVLSACLEMGKVRLVPGDDHLMETVNRQSGSIIKTTKHSEEAKERMQEKLEKEIKNELRGGCVGMVELNAEPTRAFEAAKEEVRRVIDLLRFSTKAIYPITEDIRIGLKGDHPKCVRQGFVVSDTGFNTQGDSIGSARSFEITQDTIESMEEVGVFQVSRALSKRQTSDLEEAIIRSIHWFSVALTQNETSNAFLFLIVSLESLFKAENGASIGGTVAESVAFIMSDNFEGRKKLVSIVREYYGKRSGVAHGGNKSISDSELYTLINIVGTTIMVIIGKLDQLNSQNMLMSWIEEMKLT